MLPLYTADKLTVASLLCSTSTNTLLKKLSMHWWKNVRIVNMIFLDNSRLNIFFLKIHDIHYFKKSNEVYCKEHSIYSVPLLPLLLKTADHKHGLFDNFGSFLSRSDMALYSYFRETLQSICLPIHLTERQV
jgi:hypothetical protein